MRILGIIPARAGSKGVPGKNSKPLNGFPLVEYTFKAARESRLLDTVMLSSNDERCIAFAKANLIQTPFKRPEELATDQATSLEVVQHAINYYKEAGAHYDAICLLQPTSPFRPEGFIDQAIERFMEKDHDALVSVLEVPHEYNPHWVFEASPSGELKIATGETEIISRRQELPMVYHRDGSIYLVKTSVIMEGNSFYGSQLGYIKSNPDFYVNIDTLEDWEKAERLALIYNK